RIERDPEQYFKRYNPKAPEKGGSRKGYGPSAGQTLTQAERAAELKALRGRWQTLCNAHLERAGVDQRIDLRSHAERGTGLDPERKQLPSQWRGQGRANVIALRQARAELKAAHAELARAVPDARAEVIHLEAERQRREQAQREAREAFERQAAQQARRADPAVALAEWLSAPPIPLRGSMEGIPRRQVLDNLCSYQAAGAQPAAWLSEAEQTALIQAGWIDLTDDLTPKGLGAVQLHQAQQAEHEQAKRARAEQERARAAERERQRQAAAQDKQRREEQERQQEEDRRDAQTAAGAFDGIRAPRRTARDWQRWRAHVLSQAYGDAVQAAELAKDWRVKRLHNGRPLIFWGAGGQSIADYGDRIVPSGDDAWGQPLTDQTLRTALQLAQLKGWDRAGGLDITGSAEFRERA
ncbi:MAG: MobA/MobL family protein, partial [Thiomonas sp.]